MPSPFTTPVCQSVPFLSQPERSNGFVSKNAQDAIEEALSKAIANDRYTILCYYNGNANTGRFLEFYTNIGSNEAPIHFTGPTLITSLILSTTGVNATTSLTFYDSFADPTLTTPLYTLAMSAQKTVEIVVPPLTPLFTLPATGQLVVKVNSGAIQKPHLQIVFSSS